MQFCLRIPKMSFVCMHDNEKCQKLHFKNVTSSPLPVFFLPLDTAQPKQRYCFEIWYGCCLYVFRSRIFRFIGLIETFGFYTQLFWNNSNFEFWGQNRKNIIKKRGSDFVERSILRPLAFIDCVLPQN